MLDIARHTNPQTLHLPTQEAEALASDLADLENITERGIKRVVAGLERRIRRNQELRMKHTDEPQRFLDSEMELHEVLRKLIALAGEPELYRQLIAQGCTPLLLELLQHGNMDIVAAALDLIKDLTDADSVEDLDEVRQFSGAAACVCLLVYEAHLTPACARVVAPARGQGDVRTHGPRALR